MTKIRHYKESDFSEVCSWWWSQHEPAPLPGMMNEEGTFIVEVDDVPVMTLTVLMTQSKQISYLEGFCAKPGLNKELRHRLSEELMDHAYEFLKDKGYKRVTIWTDKEKLAMRYQQLGMNRNLSGLHALGRAF